MTSLNQRGSLRISLRDDFEIVALEFVLETKPRPEGDERLEWIECPAPPITILQVRTTLVLALLSLIVTGMTLFM
jgi:hypothetical protein